ncbi:MAG TPA: nitronate monooxygenase [Gaiellaceae bacterium]|nr:nitronate monooxygenase [Gaiellaceae bacterium]
MRALDTPLCGLLGVRFPIVQAPMANVQPPELAAVVSNAGALGSIAGATLSADELRAAIRGVRAATAGAFAVNLFAPPYLREGALEVVLEERPPVFSFTFGIVEPAPLREAGIVVLGTATSADEARVLADAGVDAVVAQGAEAGGHRGSFLDGFPLVPLAELVPACVEAVSVPVVAAGGIVDGAGIAEALRLGAQGVSVGTAFLFTPECRVPADWRDALRSHATVVTPAYSGRPARAARTPFLAELMAGPPPLPYPEQRRRVEARPGAERFFLGGVAAPRARELGVAELVRALVAEAEAAARD